jgi:Holliday junction resolvase RusA-like endonuclease
MRTFVLYVDPVPKARPRFSSKTNSFYTPNKTRDFQNFIRTQVCLNLGKYFDYPMFNQGEPLCVDIDFIFRRTADLNKRRSLDGLLWRANGEDKDNLEKAVLDALNGVLWHDDRQIVDGRIRKMWAAKEEPPRVCIVVKKAGDPPQVSCDFWNAAILDQLAGRKSGE